MEHDDPATEGTTQQDDAGGAQEFEAQQDGSSPTSDPAAIGIGANADAAHANLANPAPVGDVSKPASGELAPDDVPVGENESAVARGHEAVNAKPDDKLGERGNLNEAGDHTANKPFIEDVAPTSASERGGLDKGTIKTTTVANTEAGIQGHANSLTPPGIHTRSGLPEGVESPKPPEDPVDHALVENFKPPNKYAAESAQEVADRMAASEVETGVTYEPGTDPRTVNVVPGALKDAPKMVVPERGKPIPYMEHAMRTLPESALQKGKPVGADGKEVEATYNPQPQTPDPLTLTGARPSSAYRRTIPVGAEPQPGGPRVDQVEGVEVNNG